MEVATLVPWSILCEHGLALLLVWATGGLAGCALLPFARLHIGFVGAPLLGVVFWTVALYLFPLPDVHPPERRLRQHPRQPLAMVPAHTAAMGQPLDSLYRVLLTGAAVERPRCHA